MSFQNKVALVTGAGSGPAKLSPESSQGWVSVVLADINSQGAQRSQRYRCKGGKAVATADSASAADNERSWPLPWRPSVSSTMR